ncbi:PepSY-like domain-containing protein [Neolewinella persica]|uniref:PepSY-like domain-containing protein n=1 Tax=Neolewinella persica TaxID=70998 RepID=UPI00036A85C6|nr:PepSY-like domain-containing protein [Neolewinella persica]
MKPLLFSLLALSVFLSCDGAKETLNPDQVPTAAQQAFAAAHPNTKVAWEAEGDGTFEAEFKMDGEEASANYSATGELLKTELEIKKNALPSAILTTIATQFSGHEIEEAARITYPDGRIAYETELANKNDKKFNVIFSAEGKLLKRVEPDGEDDQD